MKLTKNLAAAVIVLALLVFASTASATTLEVTGVKKNQSVSVEASLSGSVLITDPFGNFIDTCTSSTLKFATTTPFTATRVGGNISTLTFGGCVEGAMTIHSGGYLEIEYKSGTNGTLISKNAWITVPSPYGLLSCTTPSTGTDAGTLTGVASGNATLHLNALYNCGVITASWTASYRITSPLGLGVTS